MLNIYRLIAFAGLLVYCTISLSVERDVRPTQEEVMNIRHEIEILSRSGRNSDLLTYLSHVEQRFGSNNNLS